MAAKKYSVYLGPSRGYLSHRDRTEFTKQTADKYAAEWNNSYMAEKYSAKATVIPSDEAPPKQNPAPKRKTSARTQKAAVGYVNRVSQVTKKVPTKRLKKRRTINLQTPRGVFPNPAKRAPKYPGAMDVGYPTYAAFSKDAKACGYDPKELLASGEYFKESDGHVLASSMAPRENPAPDKKEITVEQSLDKKRWTIFARFPDTPNGSKNAVEYAQAYSKKEPYLHIRVMTK